VIGSLQSNEAIKLITGVGEPLLGKLAIFDALDSSYKTVEIKKNSACPICNGSQKTLLADYEEFCGVTDLITSEQLRNLKSEYILIDVREPDEHAALSIPGSVLKPKGSFEDGSVFASLPKDIEIILHCRSGVRSAQCLALLKAAGFNNSRHLKGGIIAWEESK
jgi:adenylyltransferase/sulfurtransferase